MHYALCWSNRVGASSCYVPPVYSVQGGSSCEAVRCRVRVTLTHRKRFQRDEWRMRLARFLAHAGEERRVKRISRKENPFSNHGDTDRTVKDEAGAAFEKPARLADSGGGRTWWDRASTELARKWSRSTRGRAAFIRFLICNAAGQFSRSLEELPKLAELGSFSQRPGERGVPGGGTREGRCVDIPDLAVRPQAAGGTSVPMVITKNPERASGNGAVSDASV